MRTRALGCLAALSIFTAILPPVGWTAANVSLKETRPAVTAIRVGRHSDHIRFVVDLGSAIKFTLKSSVEADELVLDLDGALIRSGLLDVPVEGTPVSAVSIRGEQQLIFALSEPVEVRSFELGPSGERGYRLVLDLYPSPQKKSEPMAGQAAVIENASEVIPRISRSNEGSSRTTLKGSSSTIASSPRRDSSTRSAGRSPFTFSGTWQQEWAVARQGGNQKFEALVEPRLDVDLPNSMSLTVIGRMRIDTIGDLGPSVYRPFNYSAVNGPWYNDKNFAIDLREFYLDMQVRDVYMRFGKQQVVWGEADGIKVLDVVNPQSFREYILDDFDTSRIPLWMANVEIPVGEDGSLQLLWIPDTTYYELAEQGTPYELRSPLLVPQAPAGIDVQLLEPDKPDNPVNDSDVGARYRTRAGDWDLSLNYFYSYADFPVPFQRVEQDNGSPVGVLDPAYKRNHLVGGTANNSFGDFSLRAELAWNSDRWFTSSDLSTGGVEKSAELASVLGLDWQGSSSQMVSAQWFYSRVMDYSSTTVRDRAENMVSLLLQQGFANDTWEFRVLALHSLDYEDTLYQAKLKYWFASELEIWIGADVFDGNSFGLFGQFDKYDRALLGFEYGF